MQIVEGQRGKERKREKERFFGCELERERERECRFSCIDRIGGPKIAV